MGSNPTGHPTKKSAVLNSGLFLLVEYYKSTAPRKAAALPGCLFSYLFISCRIFAIWRGYSLLPQGRGDSHIALALTAQQRCRVGHSGADGAAASAGSRTAAAGSRVATAGGLSAAGGFSAAGLCARSRCSSGGLCGLLLGVSLLQCHSPLAMFSFWVVTLLLNACCFSAS